ncbi:MAG: TIGR00730 family Rossman fold protein [Bacteroidota bacterium]
MAMVIGVYCASSNKVDDAYIDEAERLGMRLAQRGDTLVYGGGQVGLMGVVARTVHEYGGTVIGAIPHALKNREGIAYDVADEMHVTDTMQQRKAIIFTRADAFVVLPGGFGTLEELFEVLTLRQLGYHDKPIAIVNTDGFYDPLIALFDHLFDKQTAHVRYRTLYHFARDVDDAFRYIDDAATAYDVAGTGTK